MLAALAMAAGPAAAQASNAVVIDFDHGRLILGWVGLWLLALLTFGLCADKRIQLMARLANSLARRSSARAHHRTDNALRELARNDPRMLIELHAMYVHARAEQAPLLPVVSPACRQATVGKGLAVTRPSPTAPSRHRAKGSATLPAAPARGFRSSPMPGLPWHVQYLPA